MKNNTEQENLITPKEAALLLKCQRPNIYPLVKSGKLAGVRKERGMMVTVESAMALAKERGYTEHDVPPTHAPAANPLLGEKAEKPTGHEMPTAAADTRSLKPSKPTPTIATTLDITTTERRVPIRAIEFDESVQVRVSLDQATVLEYSERMRAGELFPAVQLFEDKEKLFIGDGWHRLAAAKKLGYATFPACVSTGGRLAAIRFALSANASHGLPRSQADKLKAIAVAALQFPNVSNREVARLCAVSEGFVRTHRTSCVANAPGTRIGADGKRYASKKSSRHQKESPSSDLSIRKKANEAQVKKVCALIGRLDLPSLLAIRCALEPKIAQLASEQNDAQAATASSKKAA